MRLVLLDQNRYGLVVDTSEATFVVDIKNSLGVLVPTDPISVGILNGIFNRDNVWGALVENWRYARIGLKRLHTAAARGWTEGLIVLAVVEPGSELIAVSNSPTGIVALDIVEADDSLSETDSSLATCQTDEKIVPLSSARRRPAK